MENILIDIAINSGLALLGLAGIALVLVILKKIEERRTAPPTPSTEQIRTPIKVLILIGLALLLMMVFAPETREPLLGIFIGLLVVFVVFLLIGLFSPFFVDHLVSNPRAKPGIPKPPIKPGRIYFFTFLEDGQVKILVKGGEFDGAIMANPERVFVRGERDPDPRNADHWWIRPANPTEREEPISQFKLVFWNPLSWWIHWMYYWNCAVWVGVPFFRELRIDRNVRVTEKKENERVVLDTKTGLPVLIDIEDWTDHLRTKTFYWYFKVPSVDTRDNVKIGYTGVLRVRCVNPYIASFNVDHWDIALTREVSTWVNNFNRAKLYDELVASFDQTSNEMAGFLLVELNRALNPVDQEEKGIGMEVVGVNIIDQEPHLTEAQERAKTAKWEAERLALATVVTAEAAKTKRIKESEGESTAIVNVSVAKAQAILNEIAAINTNDELGRLLAKYKMIERVGEANKAMLFLGNEGGTDINAALLAKLNEIEHKLNNNDR
jgi:regulator of protease activity HflC (stomatin/prohibitin superfamily)